MVSVVVVSLVLVVVFVVVFSTVTVEAAGSVEEANPQYPPY